MSARITIGSTYYRGGFFNQTKDMPWLPRNNNYSNISITIQCSGSNTNTGVTAEIRYRGKNGSGAWINRSHSARIFAKPSKPLTSWFSENLHEGDEVLFEQVDELNYIMRPAVKIKPTPPSEIDRSIKIENESKLTFNECKKLGFVHIGYFYLIDNDLEFSLVGVSNENGCYFFMKNNEVCYIGVTNNGIRHRMRQYRKPGPSQKTNQYVKNNMLEILPQVSKISIFFLEDKVIALLDICILQHDIKVKSDNKLLERFLINGLRPRWNRS